MANNNTTPDNTTTVVNTAPESTTETAVPNTAPENKTATIQKRKKIKIKIPRTQSNQEDVFVSVNNEKYQIKRGVEVEVPWYVAEVISNQEKALETYYENQEKAQKRVLNS